MDKYIQFTDLFD